MSSVDWASENNCKLQKKSQKQWLTLIWDINGSLYRTDLSNMVQIRTEASMAAKNLIVYHSRDWQPIENICEYLK